MKHCGWKIGLCISLLGVGGACQADGLLAAQVAYQQASQAAQKAQLQLNNTQQAITFAEQKLAGAQRDYNQALEAKQTAEARVSETQAALQHATDFLNQAWQQNKPAPQ